MIKNVYRQNSFIHYEWGPEKVLTVVAKQMVMEMVDDKEQHTVSWLNSSVTLLVSKAPLNRTVKNGCF